MLNPQINSNNSKKKSNRGIQINSPHMNGRIQKRAERRMQIACNINNTIHPPGTKVRVNATGQWIHTAGGALKYY